MENETTPKMTKKKMALIALPFVVGFMFIASGEKTNPKIEREVKWSSPAVKDLFSRTCQDCHSHETKWPWYANVAPVSWMVIHNVNEARGEFNISGTKLGEADEAYEKFEEGEMPPAPYLLLHPEAKLTDAERKTLLEGLKATFGEKKHDDKHDDDKHE